MTCRRIVPGFGAGLLFVAVSAFGQVSVPVSGFVTPLSQLPPIGLASSETAQVNVVNTAAASSGGGAPSCTGSITFYNSSGAAIGAATSFAIGSGQIFSATLPYASSGASGARTVVRAVIVLIVTVTGGVLPGPCSLASSIETYDTATGVTHLFVASAAQGLTGFIRLSPSAPAN